MKIRNVAIVSLSSGTIGEAFARHELEIGVRRLEGFGLSVRFMPHALKGIEFVKNHPEARAVDLLAALRDPGIDMILCAIGGDDTYRLLPHLFGGDELCSAVSDKVFLGFSDTTINHLMLHKVGLNTFYGQSFLADVCELDGDMLPYTKRYFEELIHTGTIREVPATLGMRAGATLAPVRSACRLWPTRTEGLSCSRAPGLSPVRYWAGASIPSMMSSTANAMPICPSSAGSMGCFQLRRAGGAGYCCWRAARKSRRRRNTDEHCDT